MTSNESRTISYVDALREGMRQAMEDDPSVIVIGEDVSGGAGLGKEHEDAKGGAFGATKGLLPQFGPARVRDTPISESAIVGAAIGAAATGLRPIVDLVWANFATLAFNQICNQLAKLHFMSGGQLRAPVTIRIVMGAGLNAGAQHSDILYSCFAHLPGLKVVAPTTPDDAKGLLLSAVFDDAPTLIFEHLQLYVRKGVVPEERYRTPLGSAVIRRPGESVTVVAISRMVEVALAAAERAAAGGVSVEVIDLRSLSPIDEQTLCSSVRKTGALVVVDESPPRCGMAADIVATVVEAELGSLRNPPRRVCAPHTPVPFSPPLEAAYIPGVDTVLSAINVVAQG